MKNFMIGLVVGVVVSGLTALIVIFALVKLVGSFGERHEPLKVLCCLREMREGCPSPLPSHDATVAQQRKHPLFFAGSAKTK